MRRSNHTLVVYATLGLLLVDLWVILGRFNPMRRGLVYPLSITDPWKILANAAGAFLVVGIVRMMYQRLQLSPPSKSAVRGSPAFETPGTYFDWLLLVMLLCAALSGFATEALHLARIDSLRFVAYAGHLVLVLTLLILLPYSKLAHVGFRTLALVFARRYGLLREDTAAIRRLREVT